MNRFFVGAFWSAREEDRQECAARVATYLRGLAPLPSELSTFYKGQWTRKTPLKQLPVLPNDLMPFLGQYYTSFAPRQLMPQLGYRLIAWNGLPDELRVAKIHIHCGAYGAHVSNSATLEFKSVEDADLTKLRHLMQAAISAFDPDRAVATWQATGDNLLKVECFTYDRSRGLQPKLS